MKDSLAKNIKENSDSILRCVREVEAVTNFNTITENGIYVFGGGESVGAPNVGDYGMLVSFSCQGYVFQFFFGFASGWIYFRSNAHKNNQGSWSGWEHLFSSVVST